MITAYRYGSPRQPGEGLRLGVTRQVPRGVRREDWQKRDYFDLWLPLLSPSADLVKRYLHANLPFAAFAHAYRKELDTFECRQVIALLAAVSRAQPISIGCFCEDESRCHRSILKRLLEDAAKKSQ